MAPKRAKSAPKMRRTKSRSIQPPRDEEEKKKEDPHLKQTTPRPSSARIEQHGRQLSPSIVLVPCLKEDIAEKHQNEPHDLHVFILRPLPTENVYYKSEITYNFASRFNQEEISKPQEGAIKSPGKQIGESGDVGKGGDGNRSQQGLISGKPALSPFKRASSPFRSSLDLLSPELKIGSDTIPISDLIPRFNKDSNYFTPGFIQTAFPISNISLIKAKFDEVVFQRLTEAEGDDNSNIEIAKPQCNYCSLCKANYSNYLTHLQDSKHASLIANNRIEIWIKEITLDFKLGKAPPREKKEDPQHNQEGPVPGKRSRQPKFIQSELGQPRKLRNFKVRLTNRGSISPHSKKTRSSKSPKTESFVMKQR